MEDNLANFKGKSREIVPRPAGEAIKLLPMKAQPFILGSMSAVAVWSAVLAVCNSLHS